MDNELPGSLFPAQEVIMDFIVKKGDAVKLKTSCLVAGVYEKKARKGVLAEIDAALGGVLRKAVRSGEFKGSPGQLLQVAPAAGVGAQRVIFVGLGPEAKVDGEAQRRAVGAALQKARDARAADFALVFDSFDIRQAVQDRARFLAEGVLLGDYRFDRYQTIEDVKPQAAPKKIIFLTGSTREQNDIRDGISAAEAICRGCQGGRLQVHCPEQAGA